MPSVSDAMKVPIGPKLTPREEEIVKFILAAQSNRAIAEALGISEQSVKNRLTLLYRKLGVNSRLQLMRALMKGPR
jgi:DNA-binding NarL/FixJ family response regulator